MVRRLVFYSTLLVLDLVILLHWFQSATLLYSAKFVVNCITLFLPQNHSILENAMYSPDYVVL